MIVILQYINYTLYFFNNVFHNLIVILNKNNFHINSDDHKYYESLAYAMSPEPFEGSENTKSEINISDTHARNASGSYALVNSFNSKDSTMDTDMVYKGLTNLARGIAVAAGLIGASIIAFSSLGTSTTVKLGIMAAGGLIGGVTIALVNAANSITQNNIGKDKSSNLKSSTPPTTPTSQKF